MTKTRSRLAVGAIVLLLAVATAIVPHIAVQAKDGSDDNEANTGTGTSTTANSQQSESETEAQQKATEQAKEQAEKLAEQRKQADEQRQETLKKEAEQEAETQKKEDDSFTKACDGKKEGFTTRLNNMSTNATKLGDKLTAIDTKVEAYVKGHNLTVANYTALLAAVKTQQQLLQNIAATAHTQAANFTCGTSKDAAKASAQAFKDVLQQEIAILKEYKTALKNLISAVKTAAEAQQGASNGSNQ